MTKREEARASFSRLQNFLRIVPWLILLITLVVAALTVYQSLQAKESLFRAWVTELSYKKRIEFNGFVEPVVTNLKIAREWGREHGFELEKRELINSYFMPILKNIPQISALIIANSAGQSYYLRHRDNGWQSRSSDPAAWPGRVLWTEWSEGQAAADGKFADNDYDARKRPWFKGVMAVENDEDIYWTAPYRFSCDGQIGITASLRWSNKGTTVAQNDSAGSNPGSGDDKCVVAFDIKLCDLLNWLAELDLGADGQAFMLSEEGRVFGSSQSDCRNLHDNLQTLEFSIKEKFSSAFAKWEKSSEKTEQIFSFRAAGMSWWAGFASLKIGDRHLWMAVVVPGKDILAIADYPVTYFIMPLLVFVVGIILFLLSFSFVRRHLRSLEALRRENHRLVEDELQREAVLDDPGQRIYALIKAGESERLEFKSTVRWNLQKDRAGKEIEVAWLKGVVGFLNTTGGVLLIGVEDDGTIAGLERDNFTNDDKCLRHIDSLISSHIGLEFSRFIHFAIVEVAGKKIVEIRCHASEIPAFLKKGEVEEFFIRTGPASRKLKPSQIIKYLASRKITPDADTAEPSAADND